MGDIEYWTIYRCPMCGLCGLEPLGLNNCRCVCAVERIEVVRATDHRGAVDRAEKAERERDEAIRTLMCLADEVSGTPIATDLSILGGR